MKSVPLFLSKRETISTLLVIVVLFLSSLSYEFYKYKKITTYSLHVANAKVLNSYQKEDKDYRVLKLKSKDLIFYTTNQKALGRGDKVKAIIYTKNINFYSYLKGFYTPLKSLHVKSKAEKNSIVDFVQTQHSSLVTKEIYSALFFAMPISKELRENITKWGITHLVAISGFHLGILSAILFFLLKPIYAFFQDRYFPYRNRTADLAFIVFLLLGSYAYFIDMTPSVLRAYTMSLIGFFLFSRNVKIISFGTLFFTVSMVLILFPKLMFSIAFWFSVSGVFFIFLFLYHFSNLSKVSIFILLHFWVYVLMLPIVHFVFEVFSVYQLFSPFLSMLFILFYPLSLALHVVGLGAVMDSFLIWFFSLHVEIDLIVTPLWFFVSYIMLSLLAIRFRLLAFFLPLFAFSLFFI
ncbi:MAG TPA: ComEC/Rec2 family competence protein [Sulfurospirillum arcachonense]|nr:ComEC/Rec2 family competence protein [Sulfurospirillum arcachonense]